MRQLFILLTGLLISKICFGKKADYDSIVIVMSYDREVFDSPEKGIAVPAMPEYVHYKAKLTRREAEKFNSKLFRKSSYGATQAMTAHYNLEILYYRNGIAERLVHVNLWTSNLFASMPLEVQRQGDCMCEGTGGYCCSKGGISKDFKIFLIGLLEKHNIQWKKKKF